MIQISDNWVPVLGSAVEFEVLTKALPTKGNLVYEYNPLRNYRLSKNMYEYKNNIFSLEELETLYSIKIEYSYNGATYNNLDNLSLDNQTLNQV
jgi:hypothetical protein